MRLRPSPRFILLLLLALAATPAARAAAQADAAPGRDAITAAKMRADLMFLAGDGFRGRLTNTPENALALEWVRSRFEWLGLRPMGAGGTYFLPYNLSTGSLGEGSQLEVARDGTVVRYTTGTGFYPHRYSASARVTAPVAFAGFGISAPALGHDDLAGDVRGKVLLVLDHEPGESDPASPFDGVVTSEHASPIRKALAAQARGAAAVLFVTDVHNHPGPENFEAAARAYWPAQPPRLAPYTLATWAERVTIPVGQLSTAVAESLLRGTGKSLAELARGAETRRAAAPVPLPGVQATVATAVTRHVVPDRNVLAAVEGSDPRLKDEWVIVSAHPDHNGADGDQIFNGADDNGSGTVALLAIAEAYARAAAAGQRPRRSVMFASFDSEERGPLMGSWGYTEAPAVPLERTVAMINMDMIGRDEEVPVGGGARFRGLPVQTAESNRDAVTLLGWSRSASLTRAVERANAASGAGMRLKKEYDNNTSNLIRRSDSWPFLQHGVPAVWFHTGLHPDYHTVYDRPEKIRYDKMERIARLVHQLSWDLANAADRPTLNRDAASHLQENR